jgi:hypothetical protein
MVRLSAVSISAYHIVELRNRTRLAYLSYKLRRIIVLFDVTWHGTNIGWILLNEDQQLALFFLYLILIIHPFSRSQWPRCLGRRSTAARLLRSWVRILPGTWMFACCVCVLSGAGLYGELITRPRGVLPTVAHRMWSRNLVWRGGHNPRLATVPEKVINNDNLSFFVFIKHISWCMVQRMWNLWNCHINYVKLRVFKR